MAANFMLLIDLVIFAMVIACAAALLREKKGGLSSQRCCSGVREQRERLGDLASRLPIEPVSELAPGLRVTVMQGPLRGLEGVLVREKAQSRLLLSVTMLNRAVSVEVEANQLALLN